MDKNGNRMTGLLMMCFSDTGHLNPGSGWGTGMEGFRFS
jgi:hypothetical protein